MNLEDIRYKGAERQLTAMRLPAELLAWLTKKARELKTSRTALIIHILSSVREEHEQMIGVQ